jgi:hypothetical protein
MSKLLTRERIFSLCRGEEEEHRDIHEDLGSANISLFGRNWRLPICPLLPRT